MENLEVIAERIREAFEAKNAARDGALRRSRELIRYCANSIRATHRADFEKASLHPGCPEGVGRGQHHLRSDHR